MRNVLFKKWIPREYETKILKDTTTVKIPSPGTNCWESDFIHEGVFHQWANAYEEADFGFGNYTVALVELQDGTIESVLPSNIKFLNN
jgi:hypothetical protein